MSSYSTPFAIFGHQARISILKLLQEGVETVSDLADIIGLSAPEITRHLSQLTDIGLVRKTPSRTYEISIFGLTSWKLFSPLRFVLEQHEFFSSHRIDKLPISFQQQLHLLQNAKVVNGTGLVMVEMEQLMSGTEDLVRVMVDQPFPFGKEQVHVRYIVPPMDYFDEEAPKKLNLKSIGLRVLNDLPISLGISDNRVAIIFFPNMEGLIDYSTGFVVTSTEGLDLAANLWEYCWNLGSEPDKFPS